MYFILESYNVNGIVYLNHAFVVSDHPSRNNHQMAQSRSCALDASFYLWLSGEHSFVLASAIEMNRLDSDIAFVIDKENSADVVCFKQSRGLPGGPRLRLWSFDLRLYCQCKAPHDWRASQRVMPVARSPCLPAADPITRFIAAGDRCSW
jgi:hypothetical protein